MLRWVLPVDRAHASAKAVIELRVAPALRASGWLFSPDATHHVSDQGGEAWLTVVAQLDDATDVKEELTELLGTAPALETTQDVLLAPGADPYRATLHAVTQVGLDVLEAGGALPLSEYEAFESPSTAVPLLVPFLNEVSESYRRLCPTYEATERFWLSCFRHGPWPELTAPGHCLWNIAG